MHKPELEMRSIELKDVIVPMLFPSPSFRCHAHVHLLASHRTAGMPTEERIDFVLKPLTRI